LEELAELLQAMAVHQAVPGALDESDPESTTVARLAGQLAADEVQLNYSMCLHGRAELGLAPDEYSALVMVLLRMLAFRPAGAGTTVDPNDSRKGSSAKSTASASRWASPTVAATATTTVKPIAATAPDVGITASTVGVTIKPSKPSSPNSVAPDRPGTSANALISADAAEEPPPWLDAAPPWDDETPRSDAGAEPEQETTLPVPPRLEQIQAAAATSTPSVAIVEPTPLGDRWSEVVTVMMVAGSITALTRELAMQAQCVAIDEDQQPVLWRLRVERETLSKPPHVDKLQQALAQSLGYAVRIEIESGAVLDTPSLRASAEKERRQRHAEALIHNDPLVRSLLSQFPSASIVPGSIQPLG
jgi:DNA polymerase-3 subunit gamma/tau